MAADILSVGWITPPPASFRVEDAVGGTKCQPARRLSTISHKNYLGVSKLLTFSKIMLTESADSKAVQSL